MGGEPIPQRSPRERKPSRRTADSSTSNSCYFRSGPEKGRRKALLKITDRCDLRCSHCFVSADTNGLDMTAGQIRSSIDRLRAARVSHITLTGGEPLIHPELNEILSLLVDAGFDVTVCTNAVDLSEETLSLAASLGRVSFNVSLDGARSTSHGKFRGRPESFAKTVTNIRRLAAAGVLKGILNTPSVLTAIDEYPEILEIATNADADYLLMNPLSRFGRGIRNQRLRSDDRVMEQIRGDVETAAMATSTTTERVFIRFPNPSRPLSNCIAGEILYVFANGDVTVCPYLVFATENPGAQHTRDEFIIGNLFEDVSIAENIEAYRFHDRYKVGANRTCQTCDQERRCGKGCPAAVIADGGRIGDLDAEACPRTYESVPVELRVRSS